MWLLWRTAVRKEHTCYTTSFQYFWDKKSPDNVWLLLFRMLEEFDVQFSRRALKILQRGKWHWKQKYMNLLRNGFDSSLSSLFNNTSAPFRLFSVYGFDNFDNGFDNLYSFVIIIHALSCTMSVHVWQQRNLQKEMWYILFQVLNRQMNCWLTYWYSLLSYTYWVYLLEDYNFIWAWWKTIFEIFSTRNPVVHSGCIGLCGVFGPDQIKRVSFVVGYGMPLFIVTYISTVKIDLYTIFEEFSLSLDVYTVYSRRAHLCTIKTVHHQNKGMRWPPNSGKLHFSPCKCCKKLEIDVHETRESDF